MFATIVVIIVIAVGGFILAMSNQKMGDNSTWLEFYTKGKDAGFSTNEIELLRRLAVKLSLEDPSSLFWSQDELDVCIRTLVKNLHQNGMENDQENQDFLSKLYDYRKKIEMSKPKNKNGISSTRQISDGQNLRILVSGVGVFRSQIVKNTGQYIAISRPIASKEDAGNITWVGTTISVYFWREDDAGYVFDTEVIDEMVSKGLSSLKINHTDSLFRTQKRKSIRVKMHKPAYLYMLNGDEDSVTLEINPGLKCLLEDISDSGCAVTIGGKANDGLRIKVQFILNNDPLVMAGTVRSVEYKEDLNRSLLHVESDPLPIEARNRILGEVFGMLPEAESDLPFRVLDGDTEAEKQMVQTAQFEQSILAEPSAQTAQFEQSVLTQQPEQSEQPQMNDLGLMDGQLDVMDLEDL